ncbi:MAG: ribulose-phosphate 3-epimerase [Deltaproteobacteria bacterium]|nr:ribulose-phosphate 3-epimerase [Deltaproteobacteria bacterium]
MKLIAPSILSADFSRLGEEIRAVEEAGADWIHVDVMDGHFVPNITVGPVIVAAAKKATKLPIDVHLMIEKPENFIEDFIKAGADIVSIHLEVGAIHELPLHRTLNRIRELGAKAGLVLNPATPVTLALPLLEVADMILLMTVNPGFGGQKFIPYCKKKVQDMRKLIDASGKKILLEVDGGIKEENIGELSRLGADIFVAGSAVFQSKDYKKTIAGLKKQCL